MMRASCVAALIVGLATGPVANADGGDAERGRVLAQTCLGCHGVESYNNVYPTYKVPKLVGQHEAYLVAALKAYQSGERAHATMHSQAATMSEQDMKDISAYIAGIQPPSGESQ